MYTLGGLVDPKASPTRSGRASRGGGPAGRVPAV